ncbi:MAG: TetR/AcrR family transcriptional regulator [Fidelibacterota bacterium]|nr:MAG: TetR/AcrR family transcriptional regulator [Candidatus Neomarinimicrobiota bacterium]
MTDKHEQILAAAVKVIARDGLERARIDDIAKEAGVGKGTVYEYFRSKEDLFNAIVEQTIQETMQIFARIAVADISPREKLRRFMHEALDMAQQMGDSIIITTEIWAQGARGHWHGGGSALVDLYHQLHERVKNILQEGIRAGEFRKMNLDGVASLLLAFGDGLMWQYILFPEDAHFENVKNEAINSFMRGIEL